ncbi:molybdopterin molybdotransferase MoeA [Candidatus Sumerlaeota bacterium]|nr:molybdopterin molybdotransferase MoeA [Candidatus Sumerlaeota bacterium]
MISVSEGLDLLLAAVRPIGAELYPLRELSGRVLAESISASHDSPPFDTSAMDGFAVRADDLASAPVTLPIQSESNAGENVRQELASGKAIRINTGAPLPLGANAVVKIEDVKIEGGQVHFASPIAAGTAIRRAGEDYRKGSVLLRAGRRLDPAAIGLIASLGLAEVSIVRKPRVGLLASGDELVEPGQPLAFGQIYNSTRYALMPLLASFGAEVHDLGGIADSADATREAIRRGFEFDMLITTGGVSMGSRDLIRPTLLELGVEEIFWKVKQRPGMPLFAGIKRDARASGATSTICLGLPGNPVSVFVTALVYARAALLRMQGAADCELPWRGAIAGAEFKKAPGLTVFARADYAGNHESQPGAIVPPSELAGGGLPVVVPSPAQGSHQFSALSSSAGIVRLEEDGSGAPKGTRLDFLELARIR